VTPDSDWWARAKLPPRPQPIEIRKRERLYELHATARKQEKADNAAFDIMRNAVSIEPIEEPSRRRSMRLGSATCLRRQAGYWE
jgi:hypothetical protein